MKRMIETDRFVASGDSGIEYVIIEYQEIVSMAHQQDPSAEGSSLKRLVTSDGSPVIYIDAETFKIASTDEIVRRVR